MFDPTTVRLSKHFLLSDFIGCHSVYVKGFANVFDPNDKEKLIQGKYLADYLEQILEHYGPLSISYGYISPELSQKIVTYQDPNKPSYHRWEIGAAADICVHDWVQQKGNAGAPINLANEIDFNPDVDWYSRMITYSESPYICIATNVFENTARRAFYENRYEGVRKPRFITKSSNRNEAKDVVLKHDWRGAGYPTYHGGGVRQLHHIRVGKYAMLTGFLYNTVATQKGYKNAGIPTDKVLRKFQSAGKAYSDLLERTKLKRLSIVRGYEHKAWSHETGRWNWDDMIWFEVIPPEGIDVNDLAVEAQLVDSIAAVARAKQLNRLRLGAYGET